MSHVHNITDADRYFVIDPISRTMTNKSDKLVVMQYDHNSESITFELPRYIEDHDMSECDRITVDFTNITRNKKEQNDDVYVVDDVTSDRDTVFFSWLISKKATMLVGSLRFSITFVCLDDDGNKEYEWGTDIYDGIEVRAKISNTQKVIDSNPDLIQQIKKEILDGIPKSELDKDAVEQIVSEYLQKNPPVSGVDGFSPTIVVDRIAEGHRITITDATSTNVFDVLDGKDGADGNDGYTPLVGVDYFTEDDKKAIAKDVLSSLLGSQELKQLIVELINENELEPSDIPELMLYLGDPTDNSTVFLNVDDTEQAVLNSSDPVPADDGSSYTITIS